MNIEIEDCDNSTGFSTCIYPRTKDGEKANWIMWVGRDGYGQLYTNREESGAVIGPAIELPANSLPVV